MNRKALSPGEHYATIRGVRLWYHVKGKGPPLVFQPGGAGWGGDITPYIETLGPLEKVRKVVYLEPRGIGKSERLSDPSMYSIDEYAEDLEALREHLGVDKVAVAGHSHGGFVALRYASKYPDRVERLLLLGTGSTLKLGDASEWEKGRAGYEEMAEGLRRLDQQNLPRDRYLVEWLKLIIPVWHFKSLDKGRKMVETYISRMRVSWEPYNWFASKEWGSFDLRGQLGHVKAPALIVVGDDDVLPLILGSKELHIELPNSELVVIPDCGHWHWFEQPDAFYNAVIPFLSK